MLFGTECEPYVFCYLDDIIVVTETFDEHLKWLEIVLRRIADTGLYRITYLGYLLDRDGLIPDPDRVAPHSGAFYHFFFSKLIAPLGINES